MITLWTVVGIVSIAIQVKAQVQWGASRSPYTFTNPTQQPPQSRGQVQQPSFFPSNNQQMTPWGPTQMTQPWNIRMPNTQPASGFPSPAGVPSNNGLPNNVPGGLPNNIPGGLPNNNMPGGLPNNMPGGLPNSGIRGNLGANNLYPGLPSFNPPTNTRPDPTGPCVPKFYQPNLCLFNGENKHKYTLQAVMNMLGDKNIEKVSSCVRGVRRVNCADYHAAEYIWKRGYCYCKRYHNNISAFRAMAPLRCVLNNCGGCSQEFYLGTSRIVDCD